MLMGGMCIWTGHYSCHHLDNTKAMKKIPFFSLLFLLFTSLVNQGIAQGEPKWTKDSAQKWLNGREWASGLTLNAHPSVNVVEFARQYHLNKNYWDSAFRFLKEHDLENIAIGKYPIDGENVFATVTENPSKDYDNTNWESHRKYIDLQYIIKGEEIIGVTPVAYAKLIKEYDENKDVANYDTGGTLLLSKPNAFFLFFPSDAHRPNITLGGNKLVKKIVIKIRYAN